MNKRGGVSSFALGKETGNRWAPEEGRLAEHVLSLVYFCFLLAPKVKEIYLIQCSIHSFNLIWMISFNTHNKCLVCVCCSFLHMRKLTLRD